MNRARAGANLAAALIALAGLGAERRASAEPGSAEAAARTHVTVHLAGDEASIAAVRDVLQERIADAGLHADFVVVPRIDPAGVLTPDEAEAEDLAHVSVDAAAGEPVSLYIVDAAWERVLVRTVPPNDNAEVTWEEVGHIVALALGALRAGEAIGVRREEVLPPAPQPLPAPPAPARAAPAPAPAPPPPPPPRWTFHGGVLYGARMFGDGALATGPGLAFSTTRERRASVPALGGMLVAEYRLASTVRAEGADVRVQSTTLALLAHVALALAPRSSVELAAGGGVELERAEARNVAQGATLRLAGPRANATPVGRALVRYVLRAPSSRWSLGLGLDAPMQSTRYVVARGERTVVLFSPWALRPFVMVGIETP